MNIFHCDHCGHLVFFENVHCVKCGRTLAYVPELADMVSLDPAGGQEWHSPAAAGRTYRLCRNYSQRNVCNWAVPSDNGAALCRSCSLTRLIPDLSRPGHIEAWYRLEVAKRRLVYSLLALELPLANKIEDPQRGLAFEFLADPDAPDAQPVLTGHNDGVISINIAEADDAEREKRRVQMHEPYRTVLGHFRHETGHYYWDRLVSGGDRLEGFRRLFGDERADYDRALAEHYRNGPPSDWQQRFVSAYASAHPWEDWAETWAHYLHMADALETAVACGLSLQPARPGEPALEPDAALRTGRSAFDPMIDSWLTLTYVLNNLNRGLGLPDGYPFILSRPAIDKLRFVHETARANAPPSDAPENA
jgi:hypothetical protein